MNELNRLLNELNKTLGSNEKVVKTFPAKKEWVTKLLEIEKMRNQIKELQGKADTLKSAAWAEIELGLGIFTKSLHFNKTTNEIEVLEEVEGIKSPFV